MTTPIIDEATVLAALRTLQDPEFGIDLVELGLIYEVKCTEGHVDVIMTLTNLVRPATGSTKGSSHSSQGSRVSPACRSIWSSSLTGAPRFWAQRHDGSWDCP